MVFKKTIFFTCCVAGITPLQMTYAGPKKRISTGENVPIARRTRSDSVASKLPVGSQLSFLENQPDGIFIEMMKYLEPKDRFIRNLIQSTMLA